MRLLIAVLTSLLVVPAVHARPMAPKIPPVRADIRVDEDVKSSSLKYILPTLATQTVPATMGSVGVARLVAPRGMPERDLMLLADQIALMNLGRKVGGMFVMGTKLTVPIYKMAPGCGLSQANLRNWHYAMLAGLRWGVAPAFLLGVRNHENPTSRRDGFGLGVKHVAWEGLWLQYEQSAYVIKALIATRQRWDPLRPTYGRLLRCGRSYAEGSGSWGPAVWTQYRRAIGD